MRARARAESLIGNTRTPRRRLTVPKASKQTATETVAVEGFEGRYERFQGGYTAAFETYTARVDASPFFAGLPDDRCQCPHWGYVVRGRIAFRYADREEVYEAGDAYYAPAGHTPVCFAGTELIEFSPTDAHDETSAVIQANMQAAGIS
jgi:hypothetical protein